jgi:hypothetical protein
MVNALNARQTMLARISSEGEQLPINRHPALTISMWANVTGTGLNDLRLFSEASTTSNDPLFNLGTANNGNNLDRLIVGAMSGHSSTTNMFFTDLYLSKSGFNSTVPRAFGYTVPLVEQEPPTLAIQWDGTELTITWTHGELESASTIDGAWSSVPGAASPYRPAIEHGSRFYRARD